MRPNRIHNFTAVFPAFRQKSHVASTGLDEAKFKPKTGDRPAGFLHGKVSATLPSPQKLFINSIVDAV
jgi:hypothetical protein